MRMIKPTAPWTPASLEDLRKRSIEHDTHTHTHRTFGLIHKFCRLEAENKELKVQMARLTTYVQSARILPKRYDPVLKRISKFFPVQKITVAQEGESQKNVNLVSALLAALTAENPKNRAEPAEVKAQNNATIDQIKTGAALTYSSEKTNRVSAKPESSCPLTKTIECFQTRTTSLHDSLHNANNSELNCHHAASADDSDGWHSDALSRMSTLPLTPESSGSLEQLNETLQLERVEELNKLLAQYVMLSSAGHKHETSRPFDSELPSSRCRHPQVAARSLHSRASSSIATGTSNLRSAMAEGGYYSAMAKAIRARHESSFANYNASNPAHPDPPSVCLLFPQSRHPAVMSNLLLVHSV